MQPLLDGYGRKHDYLRLSLTDKCNLRCTYCMPEDARFMHKSKLLSPEEIREVVKVFVEEFGVNKIRFTGGEPLVRQEAAEIIQEVSRFPVKLAITTNAILLHQFLDQFQEIGLRSLNISLDSLKKDIFYKLTLRDEFDRVMENINLATRRGFKVKLNVVVMKGINEGEILDFIALTQEENIHVRFIEFMPFDGNKWEMDKVFSFGEILQQIERVAEVEKLRDEPHDTSKAYRVKGNPGTFSVISTVTAPFCGGCNRIRVTADGKLRNCLFATREWDLLNALRKSEDIRPLIVESFQNKAEKLGGLPHFQDAQGLNEQLSDRSMVRIGG
ncbi:MAG: GTP 3',8-cyclase MoaA [Bacteroidia bacterium]|nr:GTP 3',8-cyclase MoaA [Bacteroidia bacterium]